jgi:HlyD family secretion protein
VHVRIDAYPGHEFRGVVRRIASTATVQNQGTQQEVTNFEVRIAILSPDRVIRPGMSASVDIDTQTVTQVISVPVQSVTVRSKENGKTREQLAEDRRTDTGGSTAVDAEKRDRKKLERVVFVKEGDIAKLIPVTTGIADDNYIQIISGLQPGLEVVSGPYTAISKTLKDGSKVKLEEVQSVKP